MYYSYKKILRELSMLEGRIKISKISEDRKKKVWLRKILLFKCDFKNKKKYTIRNMLPQRIRVNENKILE